jgi:hypothetical protein
MLKFVAAVSVSKCYAYLQYLGTAILLLTFLFLQTLLDSYGIAIMVGSREWGGQYSSVLLP